MSVPLAELGWNEESWGGDGSPPITEGKWWGQLTEAQREAAEQLCYFEDNWVHCSGHRRGRAGARSSSTSLSLNCTPCFCGRTMAGPRLWG